MTGISRPVRLIPQTAQPIEFACPLCATVHAAYYFSNARFKVYRCGGCGLTFADRLDSISPDDEVPATNRPRRTEDQHKTLVSLLSGAFRTGLVLLFADRSDSIVSLLEQMKVDFRLASDSDDLHSTSPAPRYNAVIVSDAIMQVADPCRVLKDIRSFVDTGTPVIFSLPLLDGSQARLMGQNW